MATNASSPLDILKSLLEAGTWTLTQELGDIPRWRAYRNSTKSLLTTYASWASGRNYIIDPLPERMAIAFSDFLFQDPPVVAAADETNAESMKALLENTNFSSKLRVAADMCVAEREVWYKIYTDPAQLTWPILEWTSRVNCVPYMAGDRVLAVAFFRGLGKLDPSSEQAPAYRLVEYHEAGRVMNVLYEYKEGSDTKGLGTIVPLQKHPLTMNIQDEWNHQIVVGETLQMLAGRVRNEESVRSIYEGVQDLILELNKTWSIDSENFTLAGKKRAVMDKKYADQAGSAAPGEEILWAEEDFAELDGGDGPFKILEYDYDATSTNMRLEKIEQTVLTRVGLARQLVDANASEGLAQTGTALRVRLLPTVAAISGKAKEWHDALPHIVMLMQQVDALGEGEGGWGHPWTDPSIAPSITLSEPFPPDQTEEANRHSILLTAELESLEQAIAELRPRWSRSRRVLEIRRILANRDGYALDDDGETQITAEQGPEDVQSTLTAAAGGPTTGSSGGGSSGAPRPPGERAATNGTPTPA
jgi:hypothetical protein